MNSFRSQLVVFLFWNGVFEVGGYGLIVPWFTTGFWFALPLLPRGLLAGWGWWRYERQGKTCFEHTLRVFVLVAFFFIGWLDVCGFEEFYVNVIVKNIAQYQNCTSICFRCTFYKEPSKTKHTA